MQMNRILIFFLAVALFMGCSFGKKELVTDDLVKGFIFPPDSIQTSVYWYWLSDNISAEGVMKDLHSMKEVGINRAFIGNIGLEDVPYGRVKMFSDEWWEILHTALKTAGELNIEIGIFNSPGWSQSGGPWVEPDEAMRYLTSSELKVEGTSIFNQKLNNPAPLFQPVKVIAFPVPEDFELSLNTQNSSIKSIPGVASLEKLTDGDMNSGVNFPEGNEFIIDFHAKKSFTARRLTICSTAHPVIADIVLQAKKPDGKFHVVSSFVLDRSNPSLDVGFKPYAPIVISFDEVVSRDFRLIFKSATSGGGIAEVCLSSSPRVERYSEKTLAKMHQTPLPYWGDYLWREQPAVENTSLVVDASKVVDLSGKMSDDGTLKWEVPEGKWIILQTGMVPTGTQNAPVSPEATGYEVDKMSKKHIAGHFDKFIGEILRRIPEDDRKTFKVVVQDSYETGGQNFTDDFLKEFKREYGYDPVPYLPVYEGIIVNSPQASDRFLWDMRRMVADKVAYDYVGGLREISHRHGLTTWLECYGHWGFPGEFLMYGGQSDEVAGEFWSEGGLGDIENRAASSCGHIYGKTKISAESNTCGGAPFTRYPAMLKQRCDRFFAEGINNTLLHLFISQPYDDKNPGMNAPFGNEFNRKNTWFSQLDVYLEYIKRTNYMLQQGLNVADVAYFIGEDTPKMTGITQPELPIGYQFDYINAEVIEKYLTVKNGMLTLPHGTQYRLLVLPQLPTMRPELLSKIKDLVMQGAVVLGSAPDHSPSLQNQPEADRQVKEMAAELWGDVDGKKLKSRKVGKGMILNGVDMEEVLATINCIPDCELPEDGAIHYGHRTMDNKDIYFISNQSEELRFISPAFRVKGKRPELWDATSGKIKTLPAFLHSNETTIVPLRLEPFESAFVVFREKTKNKRREVCWEDNYPFPVTIAELNGPWIVSFDSLQGGLKKPVVFETLQDWSASNNEQVRYYSGTAIYSCGFCIKELPNNPQIQIDLGSLVAMAKVSVNGKYVGGVWTLPYRLDITDFLKQGENKIEIEVVNTWVNRLIGDSRLPEEKRSTWCPVNPYRSDSQLQASGLLGPVVIQAVYEQKTFAVIK